MHTVKRYSRYSPLDNMWYNFTWIKLTCLTPLLRCNKKDLKNKITKMIKQGVCHTVALLFTLKSILRKKKNYGNSNISPCKNIIFQKSSKRNQNPSRYYYNSITNLKFQQKPKISSFKNPHIKIDLLLPRG